MATRFNDRQGANDRHDASGMRLAAFSVVLILHTSKNNSR